MLRSAYSDSWMGIHSLVNTNIVTIGCRRWHSSLKYSVSNIIYYLCWKLIEENKAQHIEMIRSKIINAFYIERFYWFFKIWPYNTAPQNWIASNHLAEKYHKATWALLVQVQPCRLMAYHQWDTQEHSSVKLESRYKCLRNGGHPQYVKPFSPATYLEPVSVIGAICCIKTIVWWRRDTWFLRIEFFVDYTNSANFNKVVRED